MPCRDEKIDGKIIQERRYQAHQMRLNHIRYTFGFQGFSDGHKVKMKMTPIQDFISCDPSSMKRETKMRQLV